MASMQCYRSAEETCQVKCQEKSLGQKVSDMAGRVFPGNHASHGQKTHYQDHTVKKSDCYSKSQNYSPNHSSVIKEYCHSESNSNGHNGMGHYGHNGIGHSNSQGHNGIGHNLAHRKLEQHHGNGKSGHHAASGVTTICQEIKKKKSEYKKEKCVRNKRKDGNKSCSDSSSSSDSD